jgi:hypothetical protein
MQQRPPVAHGVEDKHRTAAQRIGSDIYGSVLGLSLRASQVSHPRLGQTLNAACPCRQTRSTGTSSGGLASAVLSGDRVVIDRVVGNVRGGFCPESGVVRSGRRELALLLR